MSFDVSWDIDKYREDHESDEHWQLRRNFIERWKESYPEERLICLARVFANMEFMGCRYPQEVMQEVAQMSKEVPLLKEAEQSESLIRKNSLNLASDTNKLPNMDLLSAQSWSRANDEYQKCKQKRNGPRTIIKHRVTERIIDSALWITEPIISQDTCANATSGQSIKNSKYTKQNEESHKQNHNFNNNSYQKVEARTSFDNSQENQLLGQLLERNTIALPGNVTNHTSLLNKSNIYENVQRQWNFQSDGDISNIHASTSNICSSDSNIRDVSVVTNTNNASNIVASVTDNTNPTNVASVLCNTVAVTQTVGNKAGKKKKADKKKQKLKFKLCQAGKRKYIYWRAAGKTSAEALALAQVKIKKVPEYEKMRNKLGTIRQFIKKSKQDIKPASKNKVKTSKIIYNNGYFGNIKLDNTNKNPRASNLDGKSNNMIKPSNGTNTVTVDNFSNNSVNVSNRNMTGSTYTAVNTNTPSTSTTSNFSNTEHSVCLKIKPADHVNTSLDNAVTLNDLSRKSRRDHWTDAQQSKTNQIPISENSDKQLENQQLITKTGNTEEPLKIENDSSIIEITDDEIDANENANVKEKDMQEKRRVWWLQQGKTEEEANILCKKPMALTDALEELSDRTVILDNILLNNYLSINEIQKYKNVSSNISDNIAELDAQENIEDVRMQQLNNAINIMNAFYSDNTEDNQRVTGIHNPTEQTKYNITNAENPLTNKKNKSVANQKSTTAKTGLRIKESNIVGNAVKFQIYLKDAKKKILQAEILQLQNAIAQCINENDQVKFLRVNKHRGCAVVSCRDEYSRDWLDKQIPTLVPWDGAELVIMNEDDIPVFLYAWVYVPVVLEVNNVLNPEDFLIKLHEQNKNVGCDKWVVLSTQFLGEGQLFFVRFDNKEEKLLHAMGYKLKWFSARIKVKVKQKNKIAASKSTKTLTNPRTVSIKKDKKPAPVVRPSISEAVCGKPQKENKLVNKIEGNSRQVSGSLLGNEGHLNASGMPASEQIPSHSCLIPGIFPEPSSSHVLEMSQQNNPSTSMKYSNQAIAIDGTNVPVNSRPIPESGSAFESKTDEANINDIGQNNMNKDNRSSTTDNAGCGSIRVEPTWGIDAPRLLPGHKLAIKIRTDLCDDDNPRDQDDLRVRINEIKKTNFVRQHCNNEKQQNFSFRDAFNGRDEEYSLEERVFRARNTSLDDQEQRSIQESHIRGQENYLSNRNYEDIDQVAYRDDIQERDRENTHNEEKEAKSFTNVLTSSLYSTEFYRMGNSSDHPENSKDNCVIDERDDEMDGLDVADIDKEVRSHPENWERDWDENSQEPSFNDDDFEDWGEPQSEGESENYRHDTQSQTQGNREQPFQWDNSARRETRKNSRHRDNNNFDDKNGDGILKDRRTARSRAFDERKIEFREENYLSNRDRRDSRDNSRHSNNVDNKNIDGILKNRRTARSRAFRERKIKLREENYLSNRDELFLRNSPARRDSRENSRQRDSYNFDDRNRDEIGLREVYFSNRDSNSPYESRDGTQRDWQNRFSRANLEEHEGVGLREMNSRRNPDSSRYYHDSRSHRDLGMPRVELINKTRRRNRNQFY